MKGILRKLAAFLGAKKMDEQAAPDQISSMDKETKVMNGQEDQTRNQAKADNASTASVVELLTSILDQVRRQQVGVRVTPALQGEAERAVQIFRDIDTALDVEPRTPGGGGPDVPVRGPQGRRGRGR
jgi:hypothetical protein